MKLFEYFENIVIKSNIIKELKELMNQFNKDILTKEDCIKEMKNIIRDSKFKWILNSLRDIKEPILYIQTLKDLK